MAFEITNLLSLVTKLAASSKTKVSAFLPATSISRITFASVLSSIFANVISLARLFARFNVPPLKATELVLSEDKYKSLPTDKVPEFNFQSTLLASELSSA